MRALCGGLSGAPARHMCNEDHRKSATTREFKLEAVRLARAGCDCTYGVSYRYGK